MSDLTKLHDYENRSKKKNPFRSKPFPKSRIEWAIKSTLSIASAARYLGISYNTFKKYAHVLHDRDGAVTMFFHNLVPSFYETEKSMKFIRIFFYAII